MFPYFKWEYSQPIVKAQQTGTIRLIFRSWRWTTLHLFFSSPAILGSHIWSSSYWMSSKRRGRLVIDTFGSWWLNAVKTFEFWTGTGVITVNVSIRWSGMHNTTIWSGVDASTWRQSSWSGATKSVKIFVKDTGHC